MDTSQAGARTSVNIIKTFTQRIFLSIGPPKNPTLLLQMSDTYAVMQSLTTRIPTPEWKNKVTFVLHHLSNAPDKYPFQFL